jgi:GTPase involved in cell partitioning and DNA repair
MSWNKTKNLGLLIVLFGIVVLGIITQADRVSDSLKLNEIKRRKNTLADLKKLSDKKNAQVIAQKGNVAKAFHQYEAAQKERKRLIALNKEDLNNAENSEELAASIGELLASLDG